MGSNLAPSLNTTIKETINSGQSTLYSIPISAYTGAFFEYTAKNTAGVRAGSIMSVFSGSSVEFNETTTNDIGSTTNLSFDMSVTGTSANLLVSATTNNWEIKTIIRKYSHMALELGRGWPALPPEAETMALACCVTGGKNPASLAKTCRA